MGVRGDPALDVNERLAQIHAQLARPAVADGPRPARGFDSSHRRDHGGGAAREDLSEASVLAAGPPLIDADLSFLSFVAEVASEHEQGFTSHAGQQGARQGGRHQASLLAASEYEAEVHASHLLDPAVLAGVEPDDLVAPMLRRLRLG